VLTVQAYAKINLDLRILGVRPDGYHELATVFQSVALHDTLAFRESDGPLELRCDNPEVPNDQSNLVWSAAEALWHAAGRSGAPSGVTIEVAKSIPSRAGLGGGSADAAAALLALNQLWKVSLPHEDLARLASILGADVPFFLLGGTVEGRGRGDHLCALPDLPSHAVLLLVPGFGISTPMAYRWYDESSALPSMPGTWPTKASEWPAVLAACRNDLEAAVVPRHPQIGGLVEQLNQGGARLARMSGSGSAVFGLFDDAMRLEQAANQMVVDNVRVLRTATVGPPRAASASEWSDSSGLPGAGTIV
jgi:4-diphosphocytidyl-2-C-methyl-D-erythritol kinase